MDMLLCTQSGAICACVVGMFRTLSRDMRGSLNGVSFLLGYDGIITVSFRGYDRIMTGVRIAGIDWWFGMMGS